MMRAIPKKAAMAAFLVLAANGWADTYYVDPVNGNDDWDGTAEVADPATVETTKVGPRKTLAGIVEVANKSGDEIVALPGTYEEKFCESDYGRSRILIPAGVSLRSRDGAATTIIKGAVSPNPADAKGFGCGPGAIRCVQMGGGASVIRGFTLTGGRTEWSETTNDSYIHRGGGILSPGYVYDCVITNCRAYRGGALCSGGSSTVKCYRCDISNFDANYGGLGYQASVYYDCRIRNTRRVATIYSNASSGKRWVILRNCTIENTDSLASLFYDQGDCYNCVIIGSPTSSGSSTKFAAFTNCVFTVAPSSQYAQTDWDSCSVMTKEAMKLSDDLAPLKGSPLIDAGNLAFADSATKQGDLTGGQRIYNVTNDLGCFEYDWRPDYSKMLMPHRLTVTNATTAVSALDDMTLSLPKSSVVGVAFDCRSGELTFQATVTGNKTTLTVELDGVAVRTLTAADSGEIKLGMSAGRHTLGFATNKEGSATIGSFADPCGLILLFK